MKNPALISKKKALDALTAEEKAELIALLNNIKTRRSDPEAPAKHNALVAFMEKENASNNRRKLIGGIVIPNTVGTNVHWRYCRNGISDTGDLTGWEFLNPKEVN